MVRCITPKIRQVKFMRVFISIAIISILFSSCSKQVECLSADLVLVNGKIYTATEAMPVAEVLAIKDNKFIFVGSQEDSSSYNCELNKTLDLSDTFIFPGFIDAHAHLKGIGLSLIHI